MRTKLLPRMFPRQDGDIARPYEHDARRNGRWTLDCGCRLLSASQAPPRAATVTGELWMEWCPTHANRGDASKMLNLVRDIAAAEGVDPKRCKQWTTTARAILANLEG